MSNTFEKDTTSAWKERIEKELKGAPFEKVISHTEDGIEIQPFYVHENRNSLLNTGPDRPWSIHQEFHTGLTNKNQLILEALNAGVDSIKLTADDLDTDLKGVMVDIIHVEIGGEDFHAHWPAFIEGSDIDFNKLRGAYDFDPYLGLLITGQHQSAPMIPMIAKVFSDALTDYPNWKSLTISADHYHNAGATAVQELAFTLAQMNAYLDIDKAFGNDMGLYLAAGTDYFETASKFRAFRILWANLCKHNGIKDTLEISARSSARDHAPVDQHGNLLRATSQCMAASIGGATRISLAPFDGKGDSFSFRLARNIQKLLMHESYFDKNLNPMKGAYLFEELTKEMALKAWDLFKDIESKGGWVHFVKEGYIQRMLHKSAEAYADSVNNKERTWLGVNLYPDEAQAEWKEMKVEFDGRSLPVLKSELV